MMTGQERKAELVRRGKTLTALAGPLNVSVDMVSKVVAGKKRSRRIERVIARAIGRRLDEVFPVRERESQVA